MRNKFVIAETETFLKRIDCREFKGAYAKITAYVYPQLKENPFFGLNIKKLKGVFADIYRYRIGNFKLFYTIDAGKVMVFVLDIADRKDSYRKK